VKNHTTKEIILSKSNSILIMLIHEGIIYLKKQKKKKR